MFGLCPEVSEGGIPRVPTAFGAVTKGQRPGIIRAGGVGLKHRLEGLFPAPAIRSLPVLRCCLLGLCPIIILRGPAMVGSEPMAPLLGSLGLLRGRHLNPSPQDVIL